MKVILKQDIKGVGKADDIVNVSPGYARNFLFPRNFAVEATEQNLMEREKRHAALARKGEKAREEAQGVAEKLAGAVIVVHHKGGAGTTKLYGAVTPQDIADAVKQQTGIDLDKRKIHIQTPIKSAGMHSVPVRLHNEVAVDLQVEVVADS